MIVATVVIVIGVAVATLGFGAGAALTAGLRPERAAPDRDRRELVRLRARRLAARLDPRRAQPRAGVARAHVGVAAEGDGRDRGPPLLAARCRRLRRHRARRVGGRDRGTRRRRAARRSRSSSCATSTPGARRRSTASSRRHASRSSCRDKWSKTRILDEYLNTVYYGNHAYGVEAAAQTYFSKHANELYARAGGAARRVAAGAVRLRPAPQPAGGDRPPRRGAARAAREPADHAAPVRRGDPVAVAEPEAGPHLLEHQAAVLLLVRDRPARAPVRRDDGAPGRAQGLHDDRSAPAAPRAEGDPRRSAVQDGPGRSGRLGRAGHRRDPRDDVVVRTKGNQFNLAAQSTRQAGSTFKTLVLASAIEQGADPDSTYYTSAPFTCSTGSWCTARSRGTCTRTTTPTTARSR